LRIGRRAGQERENDPGEESDVAYALQHEQRQDDVAS
jgi:hypothetical protein